MKMPLIFFGHGSPMNAIESNNFTKSWGDMGRSILEKPLALLIFSAHWITKGETRINTTEKPDILYDMYGFPEALYKTHYDAPGSSEIAGEIIGMLAGNYTIVGDKNHGIDHGVWSTLIHAFPDADIPVIQISLDGMRSPQWHFEFGKSLSQLREQGILIIGSGNIVHNLQVIDWSGTNTYPWAVEFDQRVATDIARGSYSDILDFQNWGEISSYAHILRMTIFCRFFLFWVRQIRRKQWIFSRQRFLWDHSRCGVWYGSNPYLIHNMSDFSREKWVKIHILLHIM